jgi:hypothetical protein
MSPLMPSTNQTDLAGREWRTTSEARAGARDLVNRSPGLTNSTWPWNHQFALKLLDDLATALAKIEAMEAERDEARKATRAAFEWMEDWRKRSEAAEARVTALEGALRDIKSGSEARMSAWWYGSIADRALLDPAKQGATQEEGR